MAPPEAGPRERAAPKTGLPGSTADVMEPCRIVSPPASLLEQPLPKASCEATYKSVVTIELYSGILPGARAVGILGLHIAAKYFCRVDDDSTLVALHQHPDALDLGPVEALSSNRINALALDHPKELFIVLASPSGGDNVAQLKIVLADFVVAAGDRLVYAVNTVPPKTSEDDLMSKSETRKSEGWAPLSTTRTDLCESHFSPLKRSRSWWTFPRSPATCPHTRCVQGKYVAAPNFKRLTLAECLIEGWWPEAMEPRRKESSFAFMGLTQKLRKKIPAPCKWAADPKDVKAFQLWKEDAFAQDSKFYSAANRVVAKKTGVIRRLTVTEEETLM